MPKKGYIFTQEHRKNISNAKKDKPSGREGCKHSIETRIKMSQIAKNKGFGKTPKKTGSESPHWRGGTYRHGKGYNMIYQPSHPHTDRGHILEHRYIIEQYLKRYLLPTECVHHVNEIKTDNRIENLMVFKNHGYHVAFHRWGFINSNGLIFDGRQFILVSENI